MDPRRPEDYPQMIVTHPRDEVYDARREGFSLGLITAAIVVVIILLLTGGHLW